ncbi:hypothetical protein SAMN05444392_102306 [Seinonella peptonophila]|uniref:Uncharacterized protein n=1 Tax=Seinonella peptonophila TaxID=112248 RepID=A0A1M4VDC5_9BACL|nr:hypothetical protein [Seinonella peptonophila]SHE66971.1 hypothetical protein SAMN05444392_102306 [Seinonella peptonophila]
MDFQVITQSFDNGRRQIQKVLMKGDLIESKEFPEMRIKKSVREQIKGKVEIQSFGETRYLPFKISNQIYNTPTHWS